MENNGQRRVYHLDTLSIDKEVNNSRKGTAYSYSKIIKTLLTLVAVGLLGVGINLFVGKYFTNLGIIGQNIGLIIASLSGVLFIIFILLFVVRAKIKYPKIKKEYALVLLKGNRKNTLYIDTSDLDIDEYKSYSFKKGTSIHVKEGEKIDDIVHYIDEEVHGKAVDDKNGKANMSSIDKLSVLLLKSEPIANSFKSVHRYEIERGVDFVFDLESDYVEEPVRFTLEVRDSRFAPNKIHKLKD